MRLQSSFSLIDCMRAVKIYTSYTNQTATRESKQRKCILLSSISFNGVGNYWEWSDVIWVNQEMTTNEMTNNILTFISYKVKQ